MFPIRDHNPSGRVPFVTYGLMLANIAIFLSYWHLFQSPREINAFFFEYALIPGLVSEGYGFAGFFTSMFLHGGFVHLGGNMLFLFIFGDNIEDEMGHIPFALFYTACGIGAGIAHYLAAPFSPVPTVGASGAIAGVMGGYLLLYPKARVDILIFLVLIIRILPIPAWVMLAVWFGMQIFAGFGSSADEGGVAYWAHAGGFVIGLLLTLPVWLRRGGPSYWSQTHGHPPHPEARYDYARSRVPKVRRK